MSFTNIDLAKTAEQEAVKNYKYADMDCRAFVNHCQGLLGVKKKYLGSNDMIRFMCTDVKPIGNSLQAGDIVFIVEYDGKEPPKYKKGGSAYVEKFDGQNASHVGIYIGNGKVAESGSSIGGSAITELKKRPFNYYGMSKHASYENSPSNNVVDSSGRYGKIVNRGNFVNLRDKPSRSSQIIYEIQDGEVIEILQELYDWMKVIAGGKVGYCMSRYVVKLDEDLAASEDTNIAVETKPETLEGRVLALENKVAWLEQRLEK
ncbi:MAG: SH3 domain-containing protein [Actinomycetaceae bacterium]|nr:SH3 domain-containing protein [Actinomycetaceae bacterium]